MQERTGGTLLWLAKQRLGMAMIAIYKYIRMGNGKAKRYFS